MKPTVRALLAPFVAFALLAPLVSCGPGAQPEPDASHPRVQYELEIRRTMPDGTTRPLGESEPMELLLGFQGFVYARVVLVARGAVPSVTAGRARFAIDGEPATNQPISRLRFQLAPGDVYYSEPLLVFANDSIPSAVSGRAYALTVSFDDGEHAGEASCAGTLYWDPNCVDDGNGACLPPDAGLDAGAAPDATADTAPDAGDP